MGRRANWQDYRRVDVAEGYDRKAGRGCTGSPAIARAYDSALRYSRIFVARE